jgi:hypothetical protein
MRTALAHLHVPQHQPTWWLGHGLAAVVAAFALVYAASVLLVLTGVLLFS